MAPVAVSFYDIVLIVHIVAVIVAFGVTFAYPLLAAYARTSAPGDLAAMHRFQLLLSRRLTSPALVVVLVAGIYMALDRFSLGDPWISAAFAIVIAIGGLVGAVFIPSDRRCVELLERDGGRPGPEYEREARRQATFGSIAGVLIVAAVYLMVVKPGA